jgi:threonine dehydrogenase-like Zn-dependent dehydrogenase
MNYASQIAEKVLGLDETSTPSKPILHPTETMNAIVWHGKYDVRCDEKPRPCITDPRDIILKVTACTICGSDLHLYKGTMLGMHDGDILGHEFMGIINEVGDEVKNFKKGQRVVVAFDIACGSCPHCKRQEFTGCETTNPSRLQASMYGHKTAAMYGYSHLTGGVPGGQAEFVRVPYADVNCLAIPDDVPDEKALYLSDIIPTSWYANECGEVGEGDTVAIWGLGPIGLLAARWAQIRKASKIIGIDKVPERLNLARQLGIDIIDFSKEKVVEVLHAMAPGGVDAGLECAGFDYPTTYTDAIEQTLGIADDSSDILTEIISCVRHSGRVSIIGVYAGKANHFPIGALMEKSLKVRGGQTPVQKYWKDLLAKMRSGEFDPSFVVTHKGKLSDSPELFKKFNDKQDGVVKVFLRPDSYQPMKFAAQQAA